MTRGRRIAVLATTALAVLVLAEVGARALEPALPLPERWPDASTAAKADQMHARGCTDVVVIGNSVARDDIRPATLSDRFDRPAYNAALDAAGPHQQERWVADQVLPELDPGTVIWVLTSPDLSDEAPAVQAALTAYDESIGGRDGAIGALQRQLVDRSALARHRATLTRPGALAEAVADRVAGDPARDDGSAAASRLLADDGHGLSREDLRYEPDDPVVTAFVREQLLAGYRVGDDAPRAARDLVRRLRDDGRQVILVLPPVTDEFVELHPDGRASFDAYREAVTDIADDTGATVLDLSAEGDPSWFADTHHLNGRGAAALTTELADRLDADELLGPARCER